MSVAEGIRFSVEAVGDTPLEAAVKADRLAHNLVGDWPTDWPIVITRAHWSRETNGRWTATFEGHAEDNS